MTPAIFALVLHFATGPDVTIGQYYDFHNCTTARDAVRAAATYLNRDLSPSVECKMVKFSDVYYEDQKR